MNEENTEKAIREHFFKEILETRHEIVATRRELSNRLDRIAAIAYQNRVDLRNVKDRIDKLESKAV